MAKKAPAKKKRTKKAAPKPPKKIERALPLDRRVFASHPQVFYRYLKSDALTVIKLEGDEPTFEINGLAVDLFLALDGKRTMTEVINYLLGQRRPKDFLKHTRLFLNALKKLELIVQIK